MHVIRLDYRRTVGEADAGARQELGDRRRTDPLCSEEKSRCSHSCRLDGTRRCCKYGFGTSDNDVEFANLGQV